MPSLKINAQELLAQCQITVAITRTRWFDARYLTGMLITRIGVWVLGCKLNVEGEN